MSGLGIFTVIVLCGLIIWDGVRLQALIWKVEDLTSEVKLLKGESE